MIYNLGEHDPLTPCPEKDINVRRNMSIDDLHRENAIFHALDFGCLQ